MEILEKSFTRSERHDVNYTVSIGLLGFDPIQAPMEELYRSAPYVGLSACPPLSNFLSFF